MLRYDAETVASHENGASGGKRSRGREGRTDVVLEPAVSRLREAARDEDNRPREVARTEIPDRVPRPGGRNRHDREVDGRRQIGRGAYAGHAIDGVRSRVHRAQIAVHDRLGNFQVVEDDPAGVQFAGRRAENDGASRSEELLDLFERPPPANGAAVREVSLPVGRDPAPVGSEDDGVDLDFLDRREAVIILRRERRKEARERFEALRDLGHEKRRRGMEPSRLEEKPQRDAFPESSRKTFLDAPGLEDDGRRAARKASVPLGQNAAEAKQKDGPEGGVLLERNEHLRAGHAGRGNESFEKQGARARGLRRAAADLRVNAACRLEDGARVAPRERDAAHVRLVEKAGRDDLENDVISLRGGEKGLNLAGQALARRSRPEHVPRDVESRGREHRVDLVLEERRAAALTRRTEDLGRPGGCRRDGSAHPGKPRI